MMILQQQQLGIYNKNRDWKSPWLLDFPWLSSAFTVYVALHTIGGGGGPPVFKLPIRVVYIYTHAPAAQIIIKNKTKTEKKGGIIINLKKKKKKNEIVTWMCDSPAPPTVVPPPSLSNVNRNTKRNKKSVGCVCSLYTFYSKLWWTVL